MRKSKLLSFILVIPFLVGGLTGCNEAEGQPAATAEGQPVVAKVDLTTPEKAVTAYIAGVQKQDFGAIIAATTVDNKSKGFDFVAMVDRLAVLQPNMAAPANAPIFVEMNKAGYTAQIASQVKFFTYGLMTSSKVIEGRPVPMKAAEATDFINAVRADRLSGVELVKIGIPNPSVLNSEKNQANFTRMAKINGGDAATERVALISFEGLNFVIGFHLVRYGDVWGVDSQNSAIANIGALGTPKRVTAEEFENMTR